MTIAVVILSIVLIVACAFFCFAYFPCRQKRNLLKAKNEFMSALWANTFLPMEMARKADRLPFNIFSEFREHIIRTFQIKLCDKDAEALGNFYLSLNDSNVNPRLQKSIISFLRSAIIQTDFVGLAILLFKTIFNEAKAEVITDTEALRSTRSLIMDAFSASSPEKRGVLWDLFDEFINSSSAKKEMAEFKPDDIILIEGEIIKIKRALCQS